ncbi:hypothetical protein AVEN_236980-1 [Araneus ventricosus]|uniref:Uncharacterized protein n=1 Tax=Araneus ventricosus TaxID=182803 RepID=A0A4Y2R1Y7_ARAVE|nr:hypothetical protein AVEN_236980-1 [Araneus ventricosus]
MKRLRCERLSSALRAQFLPGWFQRVFTVRQMYKCRWRSIWRNSQDMRYMPLHADYVFSGCRKHGRTYFGELADSTAGCNKFDFDLMCLVIAN